MSPTKVGFDSSSRILKPSYERVKRHFAVSRLICQAQKEIYSKATASIENVNSVPESDSFRRLRAIIWMSNGQFYALENQCVFIRKSSDGSFSMDQDIKDDDPMEVGCVRVKPFGVYIANYGSSGDIIVKGKPMAQYTACLIVASTKITFGDIEGQVRIDGTPEDIQANINFARTKYPDVFCKNCKLICTDSEIYNKLFIEAAWVGGFTSERIDLETKQFRKFAKLSLEEIEELGMKYSQYLDEQPEPLELCQCAGI